MLRKSPLTSLMISHPASNYYVPLAQRRKTALPPLSRLSNSHQCPLIFHNAQEWNIPRAIFLPSPSRTAQSSHTITNPFDRSSHHSLTCAKCERMLHWIIIHSVLVINIILSIHPALSFKQETVSKVPKGIRKTPSERTRMQIHTGRRNRA